MKTNRATSVEDYKIVSSFQSLRRTLLEERYADRLEKPLAYWALPNDRRLPLAFLGRTIKDLLATPFEELSATPGIGQKKISSLVKLLSRATRDEAPPIPFGMPALLDESKPAAESAQPGHSTFDASIVSESLWAEWRETVRSHGVSDEKLGRIAPTLQALPTVIWHSPLSNYVSHTLSEIRQLKTHGEKRVRVVLEVFALVHEMLSAVGQSDTLEVRLVPKFIGPIERWIQSVVSGSRVPSVDEIQNRLVRPLLNQVRIDAGDAIYELSATRLGINGPSQSVRQQSKRMGVTRARVYQLLEECGRVMDVRWPEGAHAMAGLYAKLEGTADEAKIATVKTAIELFFPGATNLADRDDGDSGE